MDGLVSQDVLNTLCRNINDLTGKVMEDIESDHYTRALANVEGQSTGDTAWIIMCTILVFLMTLPGIMLYYSGLVRLQNVLATAMQGYCMAVVVTVLWISFGYSMTFAPIHNSEETPHFVVGNADRLWLRGLQIDGSHSLAPTIPEPLFCVYHLAFAVITPSLICGAFADRMKFISMLVSLGMWHLLVYCPIAHMTWHPHGFLHEEGVLDFAGGNVVHVSAGFSALVSALIIGKRTDFRKKANFHPHNLLVSITGACFLWCGWYGFNAGSALAANEQSCLALLNTIISSSSASLAWMLLDLMLTGKPSVIGIMNGSIAGLVAITPSAGYVTSTGAFIIGVVGGIGCSQGVKIKDYFNFDDALDAFGIHAVGGVIGGLMLGCLAKDSVGGESGLFYGNAKLLGLQVLGILVTIAWSSIGTGVIMLGVDVIFGLRVSATKEIMGLDRSQHASTMYSQMTTVPLRVVMDKRVAGRSNVVAFLTGKGRAPTPPSARPDGRTGSPDLPPINSDLQMRSTSIATSTSGRGPRCPADDTNNDCSNTANTAGFDQSVDCAGVPVQLMDGESGPQSVDDLQLVILRNLQHTTPVTLA